MFKCHTSLLHYVSAVIKPCFLAPLVYRTGPDAELPGDASEDHHSLRAPQH